MESIRSIISTGTIILSFVLGFLSAYAVVREINFSLFLKNDKSVGALIAKAILFIIIWAFVGQFLSFIFVLIKLQE
ncbi:MAG: ABC transporter permease [Dictyoglomus sp. NZ13-RE01]|nr:MAG: ABC transporter permease [Dictyoglomus sp. NZ13-RE01]